MKTLSTKQFWFLLFMLHVAIAILIAFFIYHQQKRQVGHNLRAIFISKVEILAYETSHMVDRYGTQRTLEFLDAATTLDPFVKSLSIRVNNDKIIISSDRHYTNQAINSAQEMPIALFKNGAEPIFNKIINFDLKTFAKIKDADQYSLLIELNQNYIKKFYKYQAAEALSLLFILSLLLFLGLSFIFYRFYILPLQFIKQKIQNNNLFHDDFLISELNYLDRTVINGMKDINSKNIQLNLIINSTADLIFFKDKDFKYLGCNEAFLKFVGKTKKEMIGKNDFEIFDTTMASLFREMDIQMLHDNKIQTNFEWVTYPNGEKVYLQTQKAPFNYDGKNVGILGVSRDLTELHAAQQKIQEDAYIDVLTKANNRRSYHIRVEEFLALFKRYKTPFTILMYDIDDFKKINDTNGHALGDEVLIQMSDLVLSTIRGSDYLFRIGGEEFIVLLAETSLEKAKKVAEKIRSSIENELNIIKDKKITVSIGLCEVTQNDTEDTLFKRVDNLLYDSKHAGKNKVSF